MRPLPLAFFTCAAIYLLLGTIWGAVMGASENFAQAPAHAHWNLLGWASMAIMGSFYAAAQGRAPSVIGWSNLALSNLGILIMIPGLARFLAGGRAALPLIAVGSVIVILGAACFLAAVVLAWRRPTRPPPWRQ